jgi:hypothetical protein
MRAKKLGRHELLAWVNSITQSDYGKIEGLSDGVAFCQIFDVNFPNTVNLNQLKCILMHKISKLEKCRRLGKKLWTAK